MKDDRKSQEIFVIIMIVFAGILCELEELTWKLPFLEREPGCRPNIAM